MSDWGQTEESLGRLHASLTANMLTVTIRMGDFASVQDESFASVRLDAESTDRFIGELLELVGYEVDEHEHEVNPDDHGVDEPDYIIHATSTPLRVELYENPAGVETVRFTFERFGEGSWRFRLNEDLEIKAAERFIVAMAKGCGWEVER